MVDLEKIKREVEDVCDSIDRAFVSLGDKTKENDEAEQQISRLKGEIVLLQEKKSNFAVDLRNEQIAAQEKKKEYTAEKLKYRKLIDEERFAHAQVLGDHQTEIDSLRMREMSLLKSEQGKIISEINISKQELNDIKKEYLEIKMNLKNLRERIGV